MGVLAKKNMLRILALRLGVLSFVLVLLFANEQNGICGGIGFFEEKDAGDRIDGCSECSEKKEGLNLDPASTKKAEEIKKVLLNNLSKKEGHPENKVILFVDPNCRYSDAAVNTLVQFKKDFPRFKIEGVIVTDPEGLKEKLLKKQGYFERDIPFSIDLEANLANQFDIRKTPAYMIVYNDRYYKVIGQPDPNEIISRLNK